MANEDQYYNPIIQAMIATSNAQRQREQQKIEREENAARMKQHGDVLKQADKFHQDQQAYQEKQHELQLKQFGLLQEAGRHANEATHLKNMQEAQLLMHGGANPDLVKANFPSLVSQMQGQGGPPAEQNFSPVAGSSQISQSPVNSGVGLFDPQAALRQLEAEHAASARGTSTGQESSKIAEDARTEASKLKLLSATKEAEIDAQKQITKYKTGLENVDKALDRTSHEKIARIMADSRVKDPTANPDTVKSLFMLGATGQIKLSPTNPVHMQVLNAFEEAGGRSFDQKEALAVKESKKLIPIFDQMEKFADTLSESRTGAFVQGTVLKGKNALDISSKTQNDLNILKSRAIIIGRALEGMTGRPLAIQLKTDLDSLPTAGITKGDAKERITNLRQLLMGVEDSLFTGMPDWQKDIVVKKYGLTPQADANTTGPEEEWVRGKDTRLVRKGK